MDRKTKPPDLLFEHDWSTDSEDFVIQIWVLNSVSFSRQSNELITRKTNSTHVRDCPVLLNFHEGLSGFFPEAIYGTFVGDFMSLLASIVVYIPSSRVTIKSVCLISWTACPDKALWQVMLKVWNRFPIVNMAEEQLQRADSNLKPSELKAAFKRSRDIDALLDEERELKEKEVQILILGKHSIRI